MAGYKIPRYKFHQDNIEQHWASDEFLIKHRGETYIVPGEIVGDDDFITIEKLIDWKLPIA